VSINAGESLTLDRGKDDYGIITFNVRYTLTMGLVRSICRQLEFVCQKKCHDDLRGRFATDRGVLATNRPLSLKPRTEASPDLSQASFRFLGTGRFRGPFRVERSSLY
jgi:hypothetical protein